ncbi:MAG: ATP synthase F1 subunit delta [Candidatus Goldbacteria bacterium]|nr:ATP synthase F1 subunit delta [Candidatus Goldiibacteriota bacterium]
MANLVLPSKYAEAIFLIAREKNILDKIREELNAVKDVLNRNILLKNIIFHPGISKDEKKNIFTNLFSGKISELVINFLKLLIDKKRERLIDDIVNIYSEKVDEYKGIKKIIVETAYPLEDVEKNKLLNKLKKLMKSEVVLQTMTNTEMLGGIIIRDKLHLIDASINQFLNSMKNRLIELRVDGLKKKSDTKKVLKNIKKKKSKKIKKKQKRNNLI